MRQAGWSIRRIREVKEKWDPPDPQKTKLQTIQWHAQGQSARFQVGQTAASCRASSLTFLKHADLQLPLVPAEISQGTPLPRCPLPCKLHLGPKVSLWVAQALWGPQCEVWTPRPRGWPCLTVLSGLPLLPGCCPPKQDAWPADSSLWVCPSPGDASLHGPHLRHGRLLGGI